MNSKEVLLLYVIFSVETYQKNNDGRRRTQIGSSGWPCSTCTVISVGTINFLYVPYTVIVTPRMKKM